MDTTVTNTKIGSINTMRFLAAILVLLYHFTFIFYFAKTTHVDMPIFRYFSQYGYLGVELFFIISGFVISLSAENRNAFGFFKSRVGRLYPLFWVSVAITGIFLFFGGGIINANITIPQFLLNLTMLSQLIPTRYGIGLLDPSYWTLAIEIKFYAIVFVLLLLKQFKRIESLSLIASSALMLAMLLFNLPLTWASYFLAGIFFYKIYRNGMTNWRIYGLCSTFFISIHFALARIPSFEKNFAGTSFSPTIIVLHILAFYIFFLLVSLNKLRVPNNAYINILGLLTYPAYLLHQQVARVLFSYGYLQGIPAYVSLPIITAFIFILSYGIHKLFETRGRILLNTALEKIVPTRIKNL